MSPHDAARCLVRNDVDYLPIDAIAGRIATTPFVVYPPGIATIVPGERLTERAQPMIDYLKMFETQLQRLPGLRGRDPGRLSRDRCVRPHPAAYLRGRGMNAGIRTMQDDQRQENLAQAEPAGDAHAVIVRPSRDGDVEAMLAIYRHHIRRGIEDGVDDSGMLRARRSA